MDNQPICSERIAPNKEAEDQEWIHMNSEGTSDTRNLCTLCLFLFIQSYLEVCFPYYHVAFVYNNYTMMLLEHCKIYAHQRETTGSSSDSLQLRPFSKGELLLKERISS